MPIPLVLAQATTSTLRAEGNASGVAPSTAGSIVFFVICAVLAVGAVLIFLQARRRAASMAAAPPTADG